MSLREIKIVFQWIYCHFFLWNITFYFTLLFLFVPRILVQVSTLKQFPNSSFSFWTMPRFVSKRHVEWYRCLKITCSKKGGQLRFWQLWPLRCCTARNPEHSCVLNLSSPIQRLSILLWARDKVGSLQTTFV